MSASSTLKEAFERVQHYSYVVSDAVGYRFYRCGAEYHFYIEPRTEVPIESIDALVGMHLRMCRSLIGHDFSPLSVELRRPRPAVIDDFERLWRAPLRFNAEHNRLRFDPARIEPVLDSGNPELARLSDAVSARYLARIERHNMEARVRTVLTQRLQHSEPTEEEVAEILNVSARTLQRKLGDSGTTFRKIVDETRHAQALAHPACAAAAGTRIGRPTRSVRERRVYHVAKQHPVVLTLARCLDQQRPIRAWARSCRPRRSLRRPQSRSLGSH